MTTPRKQTSRKVADDGDEPVAVDECGAPPATDRDEDVHPEVLDALTQGGWMAGLGGVPQAIQRLQRYLRDGGYYLGPIDGWYGERTREALCALFDAER